MTLSNCEELAIQCINNNNIVSTTSSTSAVPEQCVCSNNTRSDNDIKFNRRTRELLSRNTIAAVESIFFGGCAMGGGDVTLEIEFRSLGGLPCMALHAQLHRRLRDLNLGNRFIFSEVID
jgi:hypothetical protein